MYVCGCYMKECGKLANNTVVATIMSNIGLFKALDEAGIAYEKTAVGDKYVYENMMAGGTFSGRRTVRPYYFQPVRPDWRWNFNVYPVNGSYA